MDVEHLVGMANQIAGFFDSEQGAEEAHKAVGVHIARYWDPRMRRAIIQHVKDGGAGLTPSALRAIQALPPVKPTPEKLTP